MYKLDLFTIRERTATEKIVFWIIVFSIIIAIGSTFGTSPIELQILLNQ